MSLGILILMLTIPLGALLTIAPAWAIEAWSHAELAAPPRLSEAAVAPRGVPDSSHHPAACVASASERARRYLGVLAAPWHAGDLDPVAGLLAGHLRDRFETSVLGAIEAVRDWLSTAPPPADPRVAAERERIRETLASLIATLPTFPSDRDLGPDCHYRVAELEHVDALLRSLSTSLRRQRLAVEQPPTSPYR